MPTNTTNLSFVKPEVGLDADVWGGFLNGNWDSIDAILWGGTAIRPNLSASNWRIGGVAVTASAADINKLAGLTTTASELALLAGLTGGSLQSQLAAKAPLASPSFTGTPAAPTAAPGTNTTQIATTAFVQAAVVAAGGVDLSPYVVRANNLSDLTSAVTARQNLGGTTTGVALFTAADQATARSALGLGALATLGTVGFANIAPAAVVTAAETIAANDSDVALPTAAAVVDHVATEIAGAVAALPPSGSVLLATLPTTSGASVTASALSLGSYKFLRVVFDGVSVAAHSSTTGFLTMAGSRITAFSGGVGAENFDGIIDLDLTTGIYVSNVMDTNGNNPRVVETWLGDTTINNLTDSITFSRGNSGGSALGNFDGGNIRIYGVP